MLSGHYKSFQFLRILSPGTSTFNINMRRNKYSTQLKILLEQTMSSEYSSSEHCH